MLLNRQVIALLLALSMPAWAFAEETSETTTETTVETKIESKVETKVEPTVESKVESQADKKGPETQVFRLPKSIGLTPEQETSLAALKTELAPQLAALVLKQQEVFTAEQRAARQQAMTDAKSKGKRGKDLREAVEAATQISDQQRKDLKAAQTELRTRSTEVREKVLALLTEAQRAKLPGEKPAKTKTKKKDKKKPETTTEPAPASTEPAPATTETPAAADTPAATETPADNP